MRYVIDGAKNVSYVQKANVRAQTTPTITSLHPGNLHRPAKRVTLKISTRHSRRATQ